MTHVCAFWSQIVKTGPYGLILSTSDINRGTTKHHTYCTGNFFTRPSDDEVFYLDRLFILLLLNLHFIATDIFFMILGQHGCEFFVFVFFSMI